MAKQEGVSALYNGLNPALLRQMSYSSIRMGIFEPIRDMVGGGVPVHEIPFWKRIVAGGTAGAIGIAIANPTELIKVRMQGDKTRTRYPNGVVDAFAKTVKTEGVAGLWTGVGPNMLRAYIVNAAELGTYDYAKSLLVARFDLSPDSKATHLVASVMAGVVAAVCSQPVDLAKNRYMNQPAGPGIAPLYTGMLDCLVKTARKEGVTGLYKGLTANAARIGSWCVVMFMSYEQFRIAARGFYAPPAASAGPAAPAAPAPGGVVSVEATVAAAKAANFSPAPPSKSSS